MKHATEIRRLFAAAALALTPATALQAADNALFSMQDVVDRDSRNQPEGLGVLEGKCGEGKCGSLRIRLMMDLDGNSMISREEYITWAAAQADSEFDRIAGISGQRATPDSVFRQFRKNNAGR